MKIINLQASNIKRLTAIDITPTGNMVEITGTNGAGKTSVLDAIWWALAGKSTHQGKPVRDGETSARIRLDLGELVVVREFKQPLDEKDGEAKYTTKITVETAEGAAYPSPQTMLDALTDKLAFDPLTFLRATEEAQFRMLERYVPDTDFDAVRREHKSLYLNRSEHNAEALRARNNAKSVQLIDSDLERVDLDALQAEFDAAVEKNKVIGIEQYRRKDESRIIQELLDTMVSTAEKVDELKATLAVAKNDLADMHKQHLDRQTAFDGLPELPELTATSEIHQKVKDGAKTNEIVSQRTANLERKAEYGKESRRHAKIAAALSTKMTTNKYAVKQKIAEAKMPIEGITLVGDKILYKGIPFDQASDAEQLRLSCAIAMDQNSKLRVIRIRDGSLLDSNSLQALCDMAVEKDYQVWIERVDSTGKVGFVIEEGCVKGAKPESEADEMDDTT